MCYAAAWWARIDHIYYASTIVDALAYGDFDDESIFAAVQLPPAERALPEHELLRDGCSPCGRRSTTSRTGSTTDR